jgi:Yip1 domain
MTSSAATTASSKAPAFWEDFIDIFYAPTSVFERRRDAGFAMALLITTIVFAGIFFATRPLVQPIMDRAMDAAVAKMQARPDLSADQRQAGAAMARKIGSISASVGAVVAMPLLVLFGALVTWLVGKLFGSQARFGQMAMVATYANVPRIVGSAVGAALLMFIDPANLPVMQAMTVSPALLLGPDASPVLAAFLSRFDLFTLWVTALYGIGLAVVGRMSKSSAFLAAALSWAVATAFAVLGAARQMAG